MKFRKEKVYKETWILEIKGMDLPLGEILRPIMLVMLMLVLAFLFGTYTMDIVKFTSYMAADGAYDPTSGLLMRCAPVLADKFIVWDCDLQHKTSMRSYGKLPMNGTIAENNLNFTGYIP